MAQHKIQVWLRRDQAECVISAIDYMIERSTTRMEPNSNTYAIDDFAHARCIERMTEVRDLIAGRIPVQ